MTNKTLGQVAYEAFGSGTPRDPPWPKLWKQEQKWWQDASDAVVNRYIVVRSTADRKMLDDKEQAVIEAAKAWIKHIDYIGGPKRMPSEDKMLHASIKALLAAEGEE